MTNLDRIYLINLERSKDRLDHFMEEVERIGLPKEKIQIFKAIDGKSHVFTKEELTIFNQTEIPTDSYLKNIMACYLSHYYVMMDIQKNNYKKCLVLEDDVRFVTTFVNDLNNVLESISNSMVLCHIGQHKVAITSFFIDFPIEENYNPYHWYCLEKINDHVCKLKPANNPCGLSYIVNTESSYFTQLINTLQSNNSSPIDSFYNNFLNERDIFFASFKVLATGSSELLKTTIHPLFTVENMMNSYMQLDI